jgi:hypothetical protein
MIAVLGQVLVQEAPLTEVVVTIYYALAAVAILVGGPWAFFRFIRHRTLKRRLELGVGGELVRDGGGTRLVVRSQARNIGLREVRLDGAGTVIRIYAQELEPAEDLRQSSEAAWSWLGTWHVFGDRQILEPSEPVEEQTLIELPHTTLAALKIELRIYSRAGKFWRATEVVIPDARDDNGDTGH